MPVADGYQGSKTEAFANEAVLSSFEKAAFWRQFTDSSRTAELRANGGSLDIRVKGTTSRVGQAVRNRTMAQPGKTNSTLVWPTPGQVDAYKIAVNPQDPAIQNTLVNLYDAVRLGDLSVPTEHGEIMSAFIDDQVFSALWEGIPSSRQVAALGTSGTDYIDENGDSHGDGAKLFDSMLKRSRLHAADNNYGVGSKNPLPQVCVAPPAVIEAYATWFLETYKQAIRPESAEAIIQGFPMLSGGTLNGALRGFAHGHLLYERSEDEFSVTQSGPDVWEIPIFVPQSVLYADLAVGSKLLDIGEGTSVGYEWRSWIMFVTHMLDSRTSYRRKLYKAAS